MKLYCIHGTASQWFHDYLSNRYQYVTYNGVKSKQEIITCGVPQGSIPGPLLFLLFVNNIYLVTKASLPVLFADDTNIFITGTNSKEMCDKINEDLENIRELLCCLNVLVLLLREGKKYINPLSSLCITHLHIPISSTVIMCGEILLKLHWEKWHWSRRS